VITVSDFDIEGESPMTTPEWEVPAQFKGQVPEFIGEDDDLDEGEEWSAGAES
jgi:hypothetical protein